MSLRNEEVYFSELPKLEIGRSIFRRQFPYKTSFNTGDLIPFFLDEVVPGSTHNVTTSVVARLQTLLNPIMDNMYLDTFYFFVPMRLIYDHTKQLFGENDAGPWTRDKVPYRIPRLNYPAPTQTKVSGGFDVGSIADYFGVPVNVYLDPTQYADENFPSALPFRAYAMIVNEFFRDQNLQQPIVVHTDDIVRNGVLNKIRVSEPGQPYWYVTDLELGGKPFKAARFHDYFSSCLPQPTKSEPVNIFGGFTNSSNTDAWSKNGPFAPVFAGEDDFTDFSTGNPFAMRGYYYQTGQDPTKYRITKTASSNVNYLTGTTSNPDASGSGFMPSNLWANLNIPEATIANLRLAFQLDKYFYKLGAYGSRYREYLAAFFGVNNGDARMQIPEYLGGHRIPLSVHQVANTGKGEGAALGDLGAMSNTSDVHEDFHMSFSEHGYIIGLACVRFDNTYSQGLAKLWSRREALQFYNPVFAHISNTPVFRREISLGVVDEPGGTVSPDSVFGYQEAWADYRYGRSLCTGEMRPEIDGSLASWHLGDDYAAAPFLGETWIMTDEHTVDRVLAVSSALSNQIFADFFIVDETVQPMPIHSIPGLADHF